MTQAIKEATIEEYMALVEENNSDKIDTFIAECFGTGDDLDSAACEAFAEVAQESMIKHLKGLQENAPEATEGMMPTEETVCDTCETPVEQGETPDES